MAILRLVLIKMVLITAWRELGQVRAQEPAIELRSTPAILLLRLSSVSQIRLVGSISNLLKSSILSTENICKCSHNSHTFRLNQNAWPLVRDPVLRKNRRKGRSCSKPAWQWVVLRRNSNFNSYTSVLSILIPYIRKSTTTRILATPAVSDKMCIRQTNRSRICTTSFCSKDGWTKTAYMGLLNKI